MQGSVFSAKLMRQWRAHNGTDIPEGLQAVEDPRCNKFILKTWPHAGAGEQPEEVQSGRDELVWTDCNTHSPSTLLCLRWGGEVVESW